MIFINKRPSYIVIAKFPIEKVISSKVVNNTPITKEIYSNYNLENPIVKRYNQKIYLDGDLTLTGNTTSGCYKDSYFFSDNISHSGSFLNITATYNFNDFGGARKIKEFPNPVTLRTDNGKVVRFYQNNDFTNPVYEVACLRAIREKRGSDKEKTWYWDNWSRITRVYNLIPGETYLYKVFDTNNLLITGIYKENTSYGEFTTKGLIRTLRIIGTVNARDSGGYKTVDGTKRVRYGKLFRGSLLSPGYYNNNTLGTYNKVAKRRWIEGVDSASDKFIGGIDNVSVQEIINLGITKDIDLRDPASLTANLDDYGPDGSSSDFRHFIVSNTDGTTVNRLSISDNITVNGQVLNDGISYASIAKINSTKNNLTYAGTNLQSYDGMFVTNNTETLDNGKRQFVTFIEEVISGLEHRDANNNPRNDGAIYVHCQQGRDRTGTFMACLFALLDVDDDGIIKDYELTTTTDSIATRWHLQGSKGSTTTFPVGSNVREYIYNWATTNSPTGQYVTATQINTLKELLLEDIPEELEEAPIHYETYLIENPTIKSYLTASKRSGANEYTMNDLLIQAHTPNNNDDQDWSTAKPLNMTKGVSINELKAIQCPPGSGIKNMVGSQAVQIYKYGLLLTTDVKTEAKPNYYALNNPNIKSVTITDLITKNTYTILDYGDTTDYVRTDFGGVTDRFTFDSLPQIGTSTYSHFLDRVKPGLRKLGIGCKIALLPGDVLATINGKVPKFNPACTFDSISLVYYKDESDVLKTGITPLRTMTYTSDFDWSAFDDLAGTLSAPNKYYIAIFRSNNAYYAGVEVRCGPLHLSTPTKIWNLIPGRGYKYEAKDVNNNIIDSGYIKPEGLLRMIFLEGVYNVRDLGGWPCYDDNGNFVGRVAYDRLYRGSRPETDTTFWHRGGATKNDRRMMTNFIKLGKQLDLRESDTDDGTYTYLITSSNTNTPSASALGLDFTTGKIPKVRVSQISYWAAFDYTSCSDDVSKINPIRLQFLALGEVIDSLKNNKSTYFNCAQGADRTGTFAMLLLALVGAKDDALLKDWELTSFSGCLLEYAGSYIGNKSDYRALHNDCSDKMSPTNSSLDLVRLVETSNFLQDIYHLNSFSKNIVAWFKQVSTYTNVGPLSTNKVRYMHLLGYKEVYQHAKETTSSSYIAAEQVAGTVASSVNASYLGAINTIAGTTFTDAEQVIDFLKWKLVDYRSNVKTMAVLGDSLSAYDTDDRCPLLKLWWYQFAQSIGLDPNTDVNNNSEGSTKVARSKKNATDMGCSQIRINNLQVNGKDPDLIFVMMGGNDWAQHVPLGNYTYGDSIPDPVSTLLDFKPAFALMLTRIKNTYPHATVVCINEPLLQYESIGDNNEFVFADYMQAQVDIAKMFNCQVVDLYHLCGNLIHNNMSTYTADLMVHLNATGHTLIANIIK